jgi:hypothetical protein
MLLAPVALPSTPMHPVLVESAGLVPTTPKPPLLTTVLAP